MIHRNELLFALGSGIAALSALLALPLMVAKPKLLFGRSLSAMEPTLFPKIILSLIVVLSVLGAMFALVALYRSRPVVEDVAVGGSGNDAAGTDKPLFRVIIFFFTLTGYGLLLKPAGFLISSCLVITILSLLLGNRNWIQIGLFAVISPICLYLLATRGLLVSLPELDFIELFYAGIFNRISG